jgi:uncharacterized protein (DUF885 family)
MTNVGGDALARFDALLDRAWEQSLERSPETATMFGIPGHDGAWSDLSAAGIAAARADQVRLKDELATIDRDALPEERRLDFDLFGESIEKAIEGAAFPSELLALSQMGGVHTSAMLISAMPRTSVDAYENILERLRRLPVLIEQTTALLRRGIEQGVVQPSIIMRDVPAQIEAELVSDGTQSALFEPFTAVSMPPSIPVADAARLRDEAGAVIASAIVPALAAFHEFVVGEYVPACRQTVGLTELPDGTEWYAHNARQFTTTTLSPKEVHELGNSEVERIGAAMLTIARDEGFESVSAYAAHLHADPQWIFASGDELVAAYRALCKRIDPALPRLFQKLPRLPYGVEPMPSYAEQSGPAAYYQLGSFAAGRAGVFFANTYALESRPRWEMEALALHEAVPGHHLQLSLAHELSELAPFRRYAMYTAYVEGWGLYAESLGEELGFYVESASRFGRLAFEMWRAVRLVVDTGMHALGWTRDEAIEFFAERSGRARHDVIAEVDRYIAIPGQALAYKVGELEIQALRREATSALGAAFDIRDFHDHVLRHGAVPLAILRRNIEAWLAAVVGG